MRLKWILLCTCTDWPSGQLHNANRMRKGHTITLCLHIHQNQTNRKNLVKDIRLCQTILNLWALVGCVCVCVSLRKSVAKLGTAICHVSVQCHIYYSFAETYRQRNQIGFSTRILHYTKQSPIKVDFKWNNLKFWFCENEKRRLHSHSHKRNISKKVPRNFILNLENYIV